MKIIAEFVCSPNRKEIYGKNFIFLSNSTRDKIVYEATLNDYASFSPAAYLWEDVFLENEKGIYKIVLKLEIKGHYTSETYLSESEYEEYILLEEILIKDKLDSIGEVKEIALQIKEENKKYTKRFLKNDN